MRHLPLYLAAILVFVGVVLMAAGDDPDGETIIYEQANVEIVWGAVPSPDYNTTTVYTDKGWVKSTSDGGIVITNKGPVLELVGDTQVVLAEVDYGNHSTPATKNFPWDGKGVVQPFKMLRAEDGKWYKIPLNDIKVLATTSRHPLQPRITGQCVGYKSYFRNFKCDPA